MTRRRDHVIAFMYYNFQLIRNQMFPLLALLVGFIGEQNRFTLYIRFAFYFLVVFIVVFSFFKWYKRTFEFGDDMIRISEGVFTKNSNDLPYHRVKSINIHDTLMKRFFHLGDLQIELIGGKKHEFVLQNKEIHELKKALFPDMILHNKGKNNIHHISATGFFLLSFNKNILLAAFPVAAALIAFASKLYIRFNGEAEKQNPSGIIGVAKETNWFAIHTFLMLGSVMLFMVVVTYFFSFIYIFFAYGRFRIDHDKTTISIERGLLNRKQYHIPRESIRSVRIVEPLFARLFGYAELAVDTIGLDEGRTTFHPMIKKRDIPHYLNEYTPEFQTQLFDHRPDKQSLFVFVMKPAVPIIILSLGLAWLHPGLGRVICLVPVAMFSGYLKWKHAGITFNGAFIAVRYVTLFTKNTVIGLKKFVQTNTVEQSIFMQKRDVYHYSFSLYSEMTNESYCCKYVPGDSKREFVHYVVEEN
ncbi:PH domain-containing protein [Lentibacillus sp. N15]|uniref:PH domain-containing protein n=1 Tax=Lentibacillus songyuanensis TaxID=3136161 RepID=UPI0031BA69BB